MSAGLPSDEVGEDYKSSLEDLVSNDRYQIQNLTNIAKESIEHAETISRVLSNHVQRVRLPSHLKSNERVSSSLHFISFARLTNPVDTTRKKIACTLRARLHRQECWHSLHGLLWPESPEFVHVCIFPGRCAD